MGLKPYQDTIRGSKSKKRYMPITEYLYAHMKLLFLWVYYSKYLTQICLIKTTEFVGFMLICIISNSH